VNAKREVLIRFSSLPLKDPRSRAVLRLLQDDSFLSRLSFVTNRDLLPNTLLIAEVGSDAIPFELELGAVQREEVSLVNGHLVRHVHKTRTLCIHEPTRAIRPLQLFQGRLYVMLAFAQETPAWYRLVAEPNPALPVTGEARQSIDSVLRQIVRDQLDLALHAILSRHEVEEALRERNRERFARAARLYNQLRERCLIEVE